MRVELQAISKFLAFMSLVVCFRLAMMSYFRDIPDGSTPFAFHSLIMVWWEDALFAIPIYHLSRNLESKRALKVSLIVLISLMFGLGHAYQGTFSIFVTALYPYYLSTKNAEKYGFGTVMLCHILYDMITIGTIRLAPFLIGCIP